MPRDRRGDFSSHILFTREELFPPSSPEDLSFSLRSWDRVPELCLHSHVHGDEVTTSGFGEAAFVVCGGRGASPPGHGREWTPSPGQSCASKRGWGGQGQLWEQPGGSATRRRLEQSTEQAYGFVTPHPSIELKSKYLEPSLRLGNLTHGSQMTETFRGTSDGFWVSSEGPKKRGWGGQRPLSASCDSQVRQPRMFQASASVKVVSTTPTGPSSTQHSRRVLRMLGHLIA